MNCPDLCTKAKCQELEQRIIQLETIVEQLKEINIGGKLTGENLNIEINNFFNNDDVTIDLSDFCTDVRLDNHISTEIPIAHEYNPPPIPEPEPHTPTVSVFVNNTTNQNNISTFEITVEVDNVTDSDFFDVTFPDIPEPEPYEPNLQFDIFPIGNDQYVFKAFLDGVTAEDTLIITHPNLIDEENNNEPEPNNLNINGSYFDEVLTITASDGNNTTTATIPIPITQTINNYNSGGNSTMECDLTPVLTILEQHSEIIDEISKYAKNNYQILGGDLWGLSISETESSNNENSETETQTASLILETEKTLRIMGSRQFDSDNSINENPENAPSTDNEVEIKNIIELLQAYSSVNYHRAGYQRFPAKLIPSLTIDEDEELITLSDNLSFLEWMVKQMDSLIGQFPISFEYKTSDEEGNTTKEKINLPNIAECLTQILALNLIETENSENILNVALRNLTETRYTANTALVTHDYVRANTEYLGYKGREVKKEIPVSFTPGASNLKQTLKPSTQKVIGWEFQDSNTLDEAIKKVLFSSDIIKASLFIPFAPEGKVTGDAVQENLDNKKASKDEQWESFKQNINNPTGIYNVPKPQAEIRDIEQG